ncbi:hypothetical protein PanWU01x14_253250 [Parasponia andersonii]|uniref:Uncharacterized protein n=1 Tax=Parasponia andersonii TaxID=3476 RepID=A0A2P5BBP2_PARAD|nr:hypothetical protein PanWU01x14_253250 [Parasponia andersonii]
MGSLGPFHSNLRRNSGWAGLARKVFLKVQTSLAARKVKVLGRAKSVCRPPARRASTNGQAQPSLRGRAITGPFTPGPT